MLQWGALVSGRTRFETRTEEHVSLYAEALHKLISCFELWFQERLLPHLVECGRGSYARDDRCDSMVFSGHLSTVTHLLPSSTLKLTQVWGPRIDLKQMMQHLRKSIHQWSGLCFFPSSSCWEWGCECGPRLASLLYIGVTLNISKPGQSHALNRGAMKTGQFTNLHFFWGPIL